MANSADRRDVTDIPEVEPLTPTAVGGATGIRGGTFDPTAEGGAVVFAYRARVYDVITPPGRLSGRSLEWARSCHSTVKCNKVLVISANKGESNVS